LPSPHSAAAIRLIPNNNNNAKIHSFFIFYYSFS
jgi:hypothetical protein